MSPKPKTQTSTDPTVEPVAGKSKNNKPTVAERRSPRVQTKVSDTDPKRKPKATVKQATSKNPTLNIKPTLPEQQASTKNPTPNIKPTVQEAEQSATKLLNDSIKAIVEAAKQSTTKPTHNIKPIVQGEQKGKNVEELKATIQPTPRMTKAMIKNRGQSPKQQIQQKEDSEDDETETDKETDGQSEGTGESETDSAETNSESNNENEGSNSEKDDDNEKNEEGIKETTHQEDEQPVESDKESTEPQDEDEMKENENTTTETTNEENTSRSTENNDNTKPKTRKKQIAKKKITKKKGGGVTRSQTPKKQEEVKDVKEPKKRKTITKKQETTEQTEKKRKRRTKNQQMEEDQHEEPQQETKPKKQKKAEVKKEKGKKIKDEEQEDNMGFVKLRTRVATKSLCTTVKILNKEQQECVKRLGLGSMLKMSLDVIPQYIAYHAVVSYDHEDNSMTIGDTAIIVTEEIIEEILGIPNRGIDLEDCEDCDSDDETFVQWNAQDKKIKTSIQVLCDLIEESDDADDMFILNFITLFVNNMIEKTTSGGTEIKAVYKVLKAESMKNINWCKYLLKSLEHHKKIWNPNTSYYAGPLPFLVLLYVHLSDCDDQYVNRKIRPLHFWNYARLKIRQTNEMNNGQFGLVKLLHKLKKIKDDEEVERVDLVDQSTKGNEDENDDIGEEEYCLLIESEYKSILEGKHRMEQTLAVAIKKYPEDKGLQGWFVKINNMFNKDFGGTSGKDFGETSQKNDVENIQEKTPPKETNTTAIDDSHQRTQPEESPMNVDYETSMDPPDHGPESTKQTPQQTPKESPVKVADETAKKPTGEGNEKNQQGFETPKVTPEEGNINDALFTPTLEQQEALDEIEQLCNKMQKTKPKTKPSEKLNTPNAELDKINDQNLETPKPPQHQLTTSYSLPSPNFESPSFLNEVDIIIQNTINKFLPPLPKTPEPTMTTLPKKHEPTLQDQPEQANTTLPNKLELPQKNLPKKPEPTLPKQPESKTTLQNNPQPSHTSLPNKHQSPTQQQEKSSPPSFSLGLSPDFSQDQSSNIPCTDADKEKIDAAKKVQDKENEKKDKKEKEVKKNDAPRKPVQKLKGKEAELEKEAKKAAAAKEKGPEREKREIVETELNFSPYAIREVLTKEKLHADEIRTSRFVYSMTKEYDDIVFGTKDGYFDIRITFESFIPSAPISPSAIKCWSMLLNHLENRKSKASPLRYFFPVDTITNFMIDRQVDFEERYKKFDTVVQFAMRFQKEFFDLKKIAILFFPILQNNRYYLICFNLQRPTVYMIDSHKGSDNIKTDYDHLPECLHELVSQYLLEVAHPKAEEINKKKVQKFKIKWWSKDDVDSGIYLMRHMETFKGEGQNSWDCQLDNNKALITKLRAKYVTKLLLNDLNIHAAEIKEQALEFEKKPEEEQKELVKLAMQNQKERFALLDIA
ncbi:hypothetical protein OROMI_014336 [Orobanche minor]